MPPAKKKTPADHKPKQDGRFHFTLDGVDYSLPPASAAVVDADIDGGMLMDAALGDTGANLRISFRLLNAVADPDTLAALRAAPASVMTPIVLEWANERGPDGVNLPESSSSSD